MFQLYLKVLKLKRFILLMDLKALFSLATIVKYIGSSFRKVAKPS